MDQVQELYTVHLSRQPQVCLSKVLYRTISSNIKYIHASSLLRPKTFISRAAVGYPGTRVIVYYPGTRNKYSMVVKLIDYKEKL